MLVRQLRNSGQSHVCRLAQPAQLTAERDVPDAKVSEIDTAPSHYIKSCTEVVRLLEELRADVKKVKSEALSGRQSDGLVCNRGIAIIDHHDRCETVRGASKGPPVQGAAIVHVQSLTTTVQELKEQIKFFSDKLSAEVSVREQQAVELRTKSADLARMHRKMRERLQADEHQKQQQLSHGPQRERGAYSEFKQKGYQGAPCKRKAAKTSHWSSRLKEHIAELEQKTTSSPKWPMVSVEDGALGSTDVSKIIRIIAPGVGEDEISVDVLPNGARVSIMGSSACGSSLGAKRGPFQQDFLFDVQVDGILELREEECYLDKGVLLLVLRQVLPRRMRWQRGGVGVAISKRFSETCMVTPALSSSLSTCGSSPQFFAMTPPMSECGSYTTQSICDEDFGSDTTSVELSSGSEFSVVHARIVHGRLL